MYKEDPKQGGLEGRNISFSQNFLKDSDYVSSLIDKTSIGTQDLVVEIGPGKGIITQQLARRARKVIGVELDPNLAKELKSMFSGTENVNVVQADFLKWNLPEEPYKVFANIPFNMTADIINKLLVAKNPPDATYLIIQDNAAARFIGPPQGPISQASIQLQPFYEMAVISKIDRKQFTPVPNVDVVMAKFEQKREPDINPQQRQLYRDFVVYGYNQWKPTLLQAFKSVFSGKQLDIMDRNLKLGNLKPSEVDVNQWVGMFDVFVKLVPQDKKILIIGSEGNLKNKQSGMKKQYRTRRR